MAQVSTDVVAGALQALYDEAFFGPGEVKFTWFADNEPGSGLIGRLRQIDAATASAAPGPGRRSIVGHARHALVHAEGGLAYIRGDRSAVDWVASFDPPTASDEEWAALLDRFERSCQALREAIAGIDLTRHENLCGAMGTFTHAAYHLGAIRQILLDVRQREAGGS